jgi:1,2-diacylglycerol 3-beta-glucosyltransferase
VNTMAVDALLLALAAVPLCMSAYLAVLTLRSGRRTAPAPNHATRFDIVVPAHNESAGIAATVASLRAIQYPADRRRILVIADNCTDDTAARARAAGADVLERQHATERGKGYALAFAYQRSLADGVADAVVVVDADTSVTPDLLSAFSARFAAGAQALQAEYGVRNANASWRTRLMVIALTMFHTVRSLGRERLGLSCGLRGNGMAFSTTVLRTVPPLAYSVVEDVEYGIALGLAGVRVEYVPEAHVLGDMPTTSQASRVQRERWEGGRMAMVRTHVPPLLRASRRPGGRVPLDLALDLMVPPLTTLGAMLLLGLVVSLMALGTGIGGGAPVAVWGAAATCLAAYVVRGMVLSGTGLRAVRDMLWLPVFVIWKLTASLRPTTKAGEWVRTPRPDER